MYAVIRSGGKQYKVALGDQLEVEKLSVKGKRASFTPILVVTDEGKTIYGKKDLKPYTVVAELLGESKGDKVDVLKFRPATGYSVRHGHRQRYSQIQISAIGDKKHEKTEKPKSEEKAPSSKKVTTAPKRVTTPKKPKAAAKKPKAAAMKPKAKAATKKAAASKGKPAAKKVSPSGSASQKK